MILQIFRVVPHIKTKKKVPINVCLHTFSFRVSVSTFAQTQSCRFLSILTLESQLHSSLIEHEETLYQLTLGACQTIVTPPGPVTGCDSLSSHMVMPDLIQVVDTYELIFYSVSNCMCIYSKSHTATLYCLTCVSF